MSDADAIDIQNLISYSQYLLDVGRWDELPEVSFALEHGGVVPEADFGFAHWRGVEEIRAGYRASMGRFEACAHVISNMHLRTFEDRAVARYYVQGWHWLKELSDEGPDRGADFMVLGIMTDRVIRQRGRWRIHRRHLERLGPGVAVGSLPPWLAGLGAADETS